MLIQFCNVDKSERCCSFTWLELHMNPFMFALTVWSVWRLKKKNQFKHEETYTDAVYKIKGWKCENSVAGSFFSNAALNVHVSVFEYYFKMSNERTFHTMRNANKIRYAPIWANKQIHSIKSNKDRHKVR